ncbi:SMODS domain-containing nucleotidyltransferase [Neorhizobium galegae]|uniref:SMODS domain-containing nucleotidyltransferase n=1 Tax=Neorhizobium galegae TaxID=399 RepID=UPI001279CAC3|nr:hypothetical protein [Neorhizobium galegae]KAA9387735.1 nucleotidyltransferase [Neorhizobium galegae]MCM2498354.1 hypothetical protein [Neorhizobium galegae]MCQ1774323.1 hypothetical protein [Neorhizobium galegae]MCQ1799963.1 hypothetical protein [Neorhizobium galegae]
MKNIGDFATFLHDEVNLNKTRLESLENKAGAVQDFISQHWEVKVEQFEKQGSWSHGTIIKPPGTKGFDADLLVFVEPHESWDAAEYIESLYRTFKESGVYGEKASRQTRCVTIEYANDFTLDVVPCVLRLGGLLGQDICNRKKNEFEATDGRGFADWWHRQCSFAAGSSMKEAVRLLKYMRDIKGNFSVKSVLLTTLIGQQVSFIDQSRNTLSDTPTALKVVMDRLDDYLQSQVTMPEISNPQLPKEILTRNWDEQQYQNFRKKMNTYRKWIDEAYDEKDAQLSVNKWRDVFGEDFGAAVVKEQARSVSSRYMGAIAARITGNPLISGRILSLDLLSAIPANLTWIKKLRLKTDRTLTVIVRGTLHSARQGPPIERLESGRVVKKSQEVLFDAVNPMGAPFSESEFKIRWRIVNTDPDGLRSASELRGGLYKSDPHGKRWETAQYRGVHWVEAFLIRKRDNVCCGQSDRFFVAVE